MSTIVHRAEPLAPCSGRSKRSPWASAGRLLRLELRRNLMVWMLPLMVGLFLLLGYRDAVASGPFWAARSTVIPGDLLNVFAPLVAGVGAWTASRDGRRRTVDLIATTSRSRWTACLTSWAACYAWAMVAYGVCVAILYGLTAQQTTWGGPPWWPVALGAVGVAAFAAIGFLAGAFWPSRFTAPLAALGVLLAMNLAFRASLNYTRGASGVLLLSPMSAQDLVSADAGVFFPYPPDLFIVQTMLLGGLAVAALGALGLPVPSGSRLLRRAVLAATVAGLVALAVSVALASTAHVEPNGVVVPALHSAASDRPIAYKPVRVAGPIPIYLHPAYRTWASTFTGALDPILGEVAGLPGAPVRVVQTAGRSSLGGNPPVYHVSADLFGAPASASDNRTQMRLAFVDAFIGGDQAPSGPAGQKIVGGGFSQSGGPYIGGPAQQAVEIALLELSGVPLLSPSATHAGGMVQSIAPTPDSPVCAAARHFAALSPGARHVWLAAHLGALRADHISLAQVP